MIVVRSVTPAALVMNPTSAKNPGHARRASRMAEASPVRLMYSTKPAWT